MKEEESLQILESALSSGAADNMGFLAICRKNGLPPFRLDRILRTSLGVSGPVLVKCYKLDLPLLLLYKEKL